jgi:hypothetical protein
MTIANLIDAVSDEMRQASKPMQAVLLQALRESPLFGVRPVVEFDLQIRTVSEANMRQHWAVKAKRTKAFRAAAASGVRRQLTASHLALAIKRKETRYVVTITRNAPRALDSQDNLRVSAKALVDGIADALQMDDRDIRFTWQYEQKKSKTYSVTIRIETY